MAARPIAEAASEALLERKEELARTITERLYQARPELADKYGERGRARCLEDMRYNLEHLAPAVALEEATLFARYVVWLRDLLQSRGVPVDDVRDSLQITAAVALEVLPREQGEAVAEMVRAGIRALETGDA